MLAGPMDDDAIYEALTKVQRWANRFKDDSESEARFVRGLDQRVVALEDAPAGGSNTMYTYGGQFNPAWVGSGGVTPTLVGTINLPAGVADGDVISVQATVPIELLVGAPGDYAFLYIQNTTRLVQIVAGSYTFTNSGDLSVITLYWEETVSPTSIVRSGATQLDLYADGTNLSNFSAPVPTFGQAAYTAKWQDQT